MKKIIVTLLTGVMMMSVATGCGSNESVKTETNLMQVNADIAEAEEIEHVFADVETMDVEVDEEYIGNPVPVVENGIKLLVPGNYWCFYEEDKGIIAYQNDVFTLLLGVREGSLADMMKNPEDLQQGAIDFGGELQSDVELVTLDGKEYAYFAFTKDGDRFVVAYTDAADSGKRIGTQIHVVDEDATDLEMVEYFAAIAETAKETDEEDTTEESLEQAKHISYIGVEKETSTLEFGGSSVTFQVAEGFYSAHADSDDYWAVEYFQEDGYDRSIDCYLMPNEDWGSAENYIMFEADYSDGVTVQDSVEINGYTFYYIERDYMDEGDHIQRIEVATDVDGDMLYRISVWAMNAEQDVTIEDVMDFMTVEE